MGAKTEIAWTDATWNPVRGCSMAKGSEAGGCLNCYAARLMARGLPGLLSADGKPMARILESGPRWTGKVELVDKALTLPLKWRKPKRIFVNSLSDLFHEALPIDAQMRVFRVMFSAPHHIYQILTKRSGLMMERVPIIMNRIFGYHWKMPDFIHLGVSVEDQKTFEDRVAHLYSTPAAKRFISYEPALGPIEFTDWVRPDNGVPGLDQIIVGGESGPGARPFDIQWARDTIRQTRGTGCACFVKQLGAVPTIHDPYAWDHIAGPRFGKKLSTGTGIILKDRKGGDMSEWPEDLKVREFPT